MQSTPAPIRSAPLVLWRVAEAFLNMLHALFGAPEEIAAKHTLTRHARGFLLSWIASAEALLRRLLIIEAAACPKPEPRPRRARRRKHTRSAYTFDPDRPESWRVGFRCFSSRVRGPCFSARTPDAETQEKRFYAARPLAERYEALIRAFNDPGRFARRLARRLYAAPYKLHAILKAPPQARSRVDRFDELTRIAETAARCFNSS